jgi:hypothetical protein
MTILFAVLFAVGIVLALRVQLIAVSEAIRNGGQCLPFCHDNKRFDHFHLWKCQRPGCGLLGGSGAEVD